MPGLLVFQGLERCYGQACQATSLVPKGRVRNEPQRGLLEPSFRMVLDTPSG